MEQRATGHGQHTEKLNGLPARAPPPCIDRIVDGHHRKPKVVPGHGSADVRAGLPERGGLFWALDLILLEPRLRLQNHAVAVEKQSLQARRNHHLHSEQRTDQSPGERMPRFSEKP